MKPISRHYFQFLIALGLSIFLTSISAEELKINSDPVGANVFIRDLGGSVSNKVGVTPYEGNIQELSSSYSKTGFFLVVLEKDGYIPQSIVVSELLKSDLSINVSLEPIQDFLKYKNIDKSILEIFEAQRLIRSTQYDEAIERLKKIEEDSKNISVIPELIASAYYLKKDMKAALSWYKKAYRVNPDNKDAFSMKSYLEKSMGIESEKGK